MFSYIMIIMVVKFSLFAVYYNYVLNYMVETFCCCCQFCDEHFFFCDEHFCTSVIVPIYDDFLRLNC